VLTLLSLPRNQNMCRVQINHTNQESKNTIVSRKPVKDDIFTKPKVVPSSLLRSQPSFVLLSMRDESEELLQPLRSSTAGCGSPLYSTAHRALISRKGSGSTTTITPHLSLFSASFLALFLPSLISCPGWGMA